MEEKQKNKIFKKDYEKKKISSSAFKNLLKEEESVEIKFQKASKLEKEKISIIILTHNRKNQLIRLLNSIYSQNYSNYEIILIDDLSTDGTYEYLKNKKEKRFKYIRNEKKIDIGTNRKKGYLMATGDYIIFCDDDDFFIDDEYFSDAIKLFQDKEINMICSASYIYKEDQEQYEEYPLSFSGKMESLKYLEKFQFDFKKPTSTFPMIVRKKTLEEADFQNVKMVNDSVIYLRALMVGGYTYAHSKMIGVYRVHNSNISQSIDANFIIKNLKEKKKIYQYLKIKQVNFDIDKWLEEEVRLTVMYFLAGNEESTWKRKKLLFWVLQNVSYSLYQELSGLAKKKHNRKTNRYNIVIGICITILLFYHSCLSVNILKEWKPIILIVLYTLFMIIGYRLSKKSIRNVYNECKRVSLYFLLGALFLLASHVIQNNFQIENLFISENIYHGFFLLLMIHVCYILEVIKKNHNKKLDVFEIIILCIVTLFTRKVFFLCVALYLLGRCIREYSLTEKVRKRYFLVGVPTMILFLVEAFFIKNEISVFGILLSIEGTLLFIKMKRFSFSKIPYVSKETFYYMLLIHPFIFTVLSNITKMKYGLPVITLILSWVIAFPIYLFNQQIRIQKSKKRKKCLVVGYMNNNFGDDLFFKILFDRYKNVDFYMYPPTHLLKEYQKKYLHHKNVIFYDEEKGYIQLLGETENEYKKQEEIKINIFPLICERAKKVDFYVNIGGSIFIQSQNWKEDNRFTLKRIMDKKPAFIIGCNFGPGDDEYYEYYKNWFKGFNDICFRDEESYQKFKDLGNTRLADDVVLIYTQKHRFHPIGYHKTIGISVLEPSNTKKLKDYSKNYYHFIVSTIRYYVQKKFRIKLYVFCTNEGDLEAAHHVIKELKEEELKRVEIVEYQTRINPFIRKWKKSSYIIGTRFHANILAIAHGQSFLPIIYSDKTYNYLKNIEDDMEIYDILELEKMKKSDLVFNHVIVNYKSDEQFMMMDQYVKEGLK